MLHFAAYTFALFAAALVRLPAATPDGPRAEPVAYVTLTSDAIARLSVNSTTGALLRLSDVSLNPGCAPQRLVVSPRQDVLSVLCENGSDGMAQLEEFAIGRGYGLSPIGSIDVAPAGSATDLTSYGAFVGTPTRYVEGVAVASPHAISGYAISSTSIAPAWTLPLLSTPSALAWSGYRGDYLPSFLGVGTQSANTGFLRTYRIADAGPPSLLRTISLANPNRIATILMGNAQVPAAIVASSNFLAGYNVFSPNLNFAANAIMGANLGPLGPGSIGWLSGFGRGYFATADYLGHSTSVFDPGGNLLQTIRTDGYPIGLVTVPRVASPYAFVVDAHIQPSCVAVTFYQMNVDGSVSGYLVGSKMFSPTVWPTGIAISDQKTRW